MHMFVILRFYLGKTYRPLFVCLLAFVKLIDTVVGIRKRLFYGFDPILISHYRFLSIGFSI